MERPALLARARQRAAALLGQHSYSLYLLHMLPILVFDSELAGLAEGRPWDMVLVLTAIEAAVLLPLAGLSYCFIERPFLARKRGRRSGSLRPVGERGQAHSRRAAAS